MKYDVLEFELKLVITENDSKNIEYYPQPVLTVNGNVISGYIDYFAFFCNTHLMDSSTYYEWAIPGDIYCQQNRSYKRFNGIVSSVYIETCSCGCPGCNGINNGLRVYKKKNAFKYVGLKKDGYPHGILESSKYNLTFSKENIINVRKYIIKFFEENKDKLGDYLYEFEKTQEFKKDKRLFE